MLQQTGIILSAAEETNAPGETKRLTESMALLDAICAIVLDVQSSHALEFSYFLKPFLHLFYSHLIGSAGDTILSSSSHQKPATARFRSDQCYIVKPTTA
mmetsp:Transcript_12860/g.15693  ORF Transcript_12860/g.15693 Transcript_12860/m.15693 type:complete len:100 (-) Transcript_12860:114-413(-)